MDKFHFLKINFHNVIKQISPYQTKQIFYYLFIKTKIKVDQYIFIDLNCNKNIKRSLIYF